MLKISAGGMLNTPCTACGNVRDVKLVEVAGDVEFLLCATCAKELVIKLRRSLVGPMHLLAPCALTKAHAEYQREQIKVIERLLTLPEDSTTPRTNLRVLVQRLEDAATKFIASFGGTDVWA